MPQVKNLGLFILVKAFPDLNVIASGNPRTLPQNDQRELGSTKPRILHGGRGKSGRGRQID
jgi:hypothetical protein